MNTMEKSQKSSPPKIIKLDTALKLAEKWVSNMSKAEDDEPIVVVGRPARLGLGAKILRQSKIGPLKDPLERKLYAKLDTRTKIAEDSPLAANKKDGNGNDSDDSEDLESRTKVFDKKRAANQVKPSVQTKKRKK